MGFELKHFTPEQLAKLAVNNPTLLQDLGLGQKQVSDQEYLDAQQNMTEAWVRLAAATEENTKVSERLEKAKKGPALTTPVQLLGALIFLFILIKIIGG